MRKKILSLLIFLAFLYILNPIPYTLIHAAKPTEITYPSVPNAMTPVSIKTALPEYVRYVFNFFVIISGLICFSVLIYAGVIYLTSAGNPGRQKEATSRIGSAFLGIIIIFGSYLISTTINPQIVVPYIGIKPSGGIVLYSEAGCGGEEKVFSQDAETFGTLADGTTPFVARSFKFFSPPGELEALIFDSENFQGSQLQATSDIQDCRDCGGKMSLKVSWQVAGVYLCTGIYQITNPAGTYTPCELKEECQGGKEAYLGADTGLLAGEFNDQVKGARLKPHCVSEPVSGGGSCDPTFGRFWEKDGQTYCTYPATYFGVVLHEHANFTGVCEVIYGETAYDLTEPTYKNNVTGQGPIIESKTSSATVFAMPIKQEETSGAGVWLCEDANPQREDPKCHGPFKPSDAYHTIKVENVENEEIPNDSISSIIIEGNYLAVLFDDINYKGVCEVFDESDSNFRDNPIGRCNCIMGNWGCSDCLSSFIIIPLKE